MAGDGGAQVAHRPRRNRVPRRRRRGRVVVVSGDVAILQTPPRFAPSAEPCRIRYGFRRERPGTSIHIIIKDKDGSEVKRRDLTVGDLMYGHTNRSGTWEWDGKNDRGNYVTLLQSPLTVQLRHASGVAVSRQVNIEIGQIALWTEAYTHNNRLMMNDPDDKKAVVATVYLKGANDNNVRTRVPVDVSVSFEDPAAANTAKNNSFKYQSGPDKYLGKRRDNNAIHWEADPGSTTNSDDGFKTKCKVAVNTNPGTNLAKAKVFFKPSGVGGDNFKIKATVYASDGTTVIRSRRSVILTVWREIDFTRTYTMSGENYIDAATTHAQIGPAFEARAYVKYSRGAVNTLAPNLTVKYIGLYDDSGPNKQKNWPTDFSPQKLETSSFQLRPTAQELADYGGADATKKARAKAAIEVKAQRWFNAIVADYKSCVSDWFRAANVPGGNTLLAVQYYHPKLSGVGAEGQTNFWPAGIQINLANPGSGLNTPGHPDQASWRIVQGFNRDNISVVFKNYGTAARLQIVCRHEIGHATKSAFKRARFGAGDHSASGLMTPYGASNAFSNRDIRIIRGMRP